MNNIKEQLISPGESEYPHFIVPPHGGVFTELLKTGPEAVSLREEALSLPSLYLTSDRQIADTELLLNGGFSPLTGFMDRETYDSVCNIMRLPDGTLWPIPIVLDIPEDIAYTLSPDQRVTLRHPEGIMVAILTVQDVWAPNKDQEAQQVYGTSDKKHPGVFYLKHQMHQVYVAGTLEGLQLPPHHTFTHLRATPREVREMFDKDGWEKVIAFQTRNPMHRAHIELTTNAMERTGAKLLINPTVGPTKPGDLDPFVRVRAYEAILKYYPENSVALRLLPLAMRMAGSREALWHAIIRKNEGCSAFIVGRDHAGSKNSHTDEAFYPPLAAQQLALNYAKELSMEIIPFDEMVYLPDQDQYVPISEVPRGTTVWNISGSELRNRLRSGQDIPPWFTPREVATVLRKEYLPRSEQGVTIFFTGLSGSGKSAVAKVLEKKLNELMFEGGHTRRVTSLDGDIIRKHLSQGLGFSRQDRNLNVQRAGFVAAEITKHGGAAILSLIAPYAESRQIIRDMIAQHGGFVEVYVSTPLEVCEQRDLKGLYAQARAGKLQNFTGIDDPYEAPEHPEIVIDTTTCTPEEAAQQILRYLSQEGYITVS